MNRLSEMRYGGRAHNDIVDEACKHYSRNGGRSSVVWPSRAEADTLGFLFAGEMKDIGMKPSFAICITLSNAAVSGVSSPRTFCLRGLIRGHDVSVLIDSGSSHNIVQPRVAEFLGLPVALLSSFPVLVGNGVALHCFGVCRDVSMLLQSHKFSVSLYVLLIFGADIVLGVQWLGSLGLFLFEFSIPSIQFYHDGVLVTLSGASTSLPQIASYSQLRRFITTDSFHSLCLLTVEPPPDNSPILPSSPTATELSPDLFPHDIYTVLHKHASIFNIPHGLPPHRAQNHHIHLIPNHTPVNIKPYRYHHFQKDVMTPQVLQLLQDNSFFAKLSKCTFGASSIDYLGHIIFADGVAADPSKLRVVADWPLPQSVTDLRAFLGLTGYYRRFVRHYAALACPLTDLLKEEDESEASWVGIEEFRSEFPDFNFEDKVGSDGPGNDTGWTYDRLAQERPEPISEIGDTLGPELNENSPGSLKNLVEPN
ncbi:putative mitochondrial protein [Sesamum alatum]|uniref:Mitochondrial protein n=1 Tax=Sesamum alatum TaxID=300844 RepID=A0AAE2CSW4_9LAMI|nr:putative mitochondrial protein [Sesamum alatum]